MLRFFGVFLLTLSVNFSAQALEFPLKGLDLKTNKNLSWSPQKDSKGTVIVFLSIKCPCSNSHNEVVQKLIKDFPNFDFISIHSNSDEDLKSSQEYFASLKLDMPTFQDSDGKIADDLKAFKTPHVFILNSKSEVIFQGGVTDSALAMRAKKQVLREILEDLSAGLPPRVKESRTLGCMISRGENKW